MDASPHSADAASFSVRLAVTGFSLNPIVSDGVETALRTRAMSVSGQTIRDTPRRVGIHGLPCDIELVVVLRNGAPIRLRRIRPDDAPRLMALCHRLSLRTVYQRFFSPRRLRPEEADTLANVDYRERMAVVAEVDTGQELNLIGVARYGPTEEAATADIGLVVEDGWQGLGLGTMLLEEILQAGARQGIWHFRADVLTENRRALRRSPGIRTLPRARRARASPALRSAVARIPPPAC